MSHTKGTPQSDGRRFAVVVAVSDRPGASRIGVVVTLAAHHVSVAALPNQRPISRGHSPNFSTSFSRSSSNAQISLAARLRGARLVRHFHFRHFGIGERAGNKSQPARFLD